MDISWLIECAKHPPPFPAQHHHHHNHHHHPHQLCKQLLLLPFSVKCIMAVALLCAHTGHWRQNESSNFYNCWALLIRSFIWRTGFKLLTRSLKFCLFGKIPHLNQKSSKIRVTKQGTIQCADKQWWMDGWRKGCWLINMWQEESCHASQRVGKKQDHWFSIKWDVKCHRSLHTAINCGSHCSSKG